MPKLVNLPSLMSTRVRPLTKCRDDFKIFRAPAAHAAYSKFAIVLFLDLADAVFITMYSCLFGHHVDRL